jgi:ABC-type dipeptide/oligopeptide/nickel transport system ATPase component
MKLIFSAGCGCGKTNMAQHISELLKNNKKIKSKKIKTKSK